MAIVMESLPVAILIKAMPNPSKKYGETVCCAGVTLQGEWKRLYPIRFRQLKQQFSRWSLVSFRYRQPTSDRRTESCHVFEDSIRVIHQLGPSERARLLQPLLRQSVGDAAIRGESLTLIKPRNSRFIWRRKNAATISAEQEGYRRASRQQSFFDKELSVLSPIPLAFFFSFEDNDGPHTYRCNDWETNYTFLKWRRNYGETEALSQLSARYNDEYPAEGMIFGLGTVKARPKQWLLLSVIKLEANPAQLTLPV